MKSKTAAVLFGFFLLLSASGLSYCQEEVQQYATMEISGSVAQIDTISGKIALDVYDGIKLFFVGDETKITRGVDDISINDIQIGDPLSIVYYIDTEGDYQALRISDSNLAGG
ncbi:MAG: hypothetical protein WC301_02460 [Candidatus Omnitrophota bacterium]|jgi:hypothetical protein